MRPPDAIGRWATTQAHYTRTGAGWASELSLTPSDCAWIAHLPRFGTMRLRPFTRLENSLEFIVERPFAMLFKRSVQPAEIGKRLKRELTSGVIVTVRGRVAPNDFLVLLNPADFQPFEEHGRVLETDLEDWLEGVALASNLATIGMIRVRFESNESVRRGRFEIRAAVTEEVPSPVQYADPGVTEPFEVAGPRATGPLGYIEICSGPSTGAVFPIRKHTVSIGRDLSNDLVIESAEVSRFHAELQTSNWNVVLVDQRSMNGTFVNGLPVTGSEVIESGDQIMFGTTICRFWRELL